MFNYSDISFGFFFESAHEIRRARSVLVLRAGISSPAYSGQAARFAVSLAGERGFSLRTGSFVRQEGVFALRLGMCDVSRFASRLVTKGTVRRSSAAALIVSGALETEARVALRIRQQERFTN